MKDLIQNTKFTKLHKGYKGRGMCNFCALAHKSADGKKYCAKQIRPIWKAAHNCPGIPEIKKGLRPENRRRYHLHNMIKYRLKVFPRRKIVLVPHYYKPSAKMKSYLNELASKGYNVQLTIC